MSLDKYQQAWQSESSQVTATFDVESLSKEVRQSHNHFQATIFWRDVREVGSSLLTVIIWVAAGIGLSLPWTWYLTVLAMVWIAAFVLIDRRRHPRNTDAPGEPLLSEASKSLDQVEHQIWLLRNVFWWYLLPPAIAMMAFFVHVAWMTSDHWWEFVSTIGVLGLFLGVVYGWSYRVNVRVVQDHLEPRRNDLQRLIESLQDESTGFDSTETRELLSSLAAPDGAACLITNWAKWSENWNRIIPSWREVVMILVPTLVGAFGAIWFPLDDAGPVFFQSVVAAVIPFEIVFFGLWYLSVRRHKGQPLTGKGISRPSTPAIVTIIMILVISILAFAAIFSFVAHARSARGPGLDNVSRFDDADVAHTDQWLKAIVDSYYPSLSAVVVHDGKIVYESSVGFADVESRTPATSTTPYHVASVTKVFTASLAALLHHQGVVDLDQPAITYLPENVRISTTPAVGATITLRQLASHTSGLPKGVPGQVQSVEGRYELEPHRLYEHLENVVFVSAPGTSREYSNLGFGLLGHCLERATNKPINQLVQELIVNPLQLNHTSIQNDREIHPATGYSRRRRDGAKKTAHSLKERLAGSGGIVTSTKDLAKFLIAQMKPGVFPRQVLEQLHTETRLAGGGYSGGALGWRVRTLDEIGPILEKNGGRSNCRAWIGFSLKHQVAVAIVTNCGGPDITPIGRKLLTQSIPSSAQKNSEKHSYAKVSPFTEVRFEGEQPVVTYDGRVYQWLELDDLKVKEIVSWSKGKYRAEWQKRVAEDLVQVLSQMGHPLGETVRLRLRNPTTNREVLIRSAKMTAQNRSEVYRIRTMKE